MTTIKQLKKARFSCNGRETKIFFPSDADDNMTLIEYNEKFGVPGSVYCDNFEPINPYRPLIDRKYVELIEK